jgi:hypothetical protein
MSFIAAALSTGAAAPRAMPASAPARLDKVRCQGRVSCVDGKGGVGGMPGWILSKVCAVGW